MPPPRIQTNRLRAAPSELDYRLHRAALEWDLDSALVIDSAEDIQSRKHWSEHLQPYEHQVQNLLTFCRRAPVALIADDVGLGKTISAGLILSELLARQKARRALVLCPKILLPQWKEELSSKFGIAAVHAVGNGLTAALTGNATVVITTYDSARSRFAAIKDARFDVFILDEAHKLRNLHPGAVPPQFARAVHTALAERHFRYVLMLTATPIKNRLWDLYSLIDCLATAKGHANPLGTAPEFAHRFVGGQDGLQLNRSRQAEFRQVLSQYMVRTRRSDAQLLFPERQVKTLSERATEGEIKLLGIVRRILPGLNGLLQTSLAQALMSSPEALVAQLKNMGPAYAQTAAEADTYAASIPRSAKLTRLFGVVEELKALRPSDWRLIVFTTRKETQNSIGRAMEAAGYPVGYIRGANLAQNARTIQRFCADPPGINVIVSTDAGAEGINLQAGNVVLNYDLPWDPMIIEQRIGRVQRLASRHGQVVVINVVVAGSVEERVVARLMGKLQLISSTVGDVEAILESANLDAEGNEGVEGLIRRMVVESLQGQDIEQAMRLAVQSIERGKTIYESERDTVESQLGRLDGLHRTGPRMPKLTRTEPSLSVKDFVLGAMEADGGRPRETQREVWTANPDGRVPIYFTFGGSGGPAGEPGVFLGQNRRVFSEGRPEFTRLVGEWTRRAEHSLALSRLTIDEIHGLARQWVSSTPGVEIVGVSIASRRAFFLGSVLVKAAAAVAHDRYEKLLEVVTHVRRPLEPAAFDGVTDATAGEVEPQQWWADLHHSITQAAESDPDLSAFRRFYQERLQEESQAAGPDPARQQRARDSFEPFLALEVAGMQGRCVEEPDVRIAVAIDGQGDYETILQMSPDGPAFAGPKLARCEETGRAVPESFLDTCSVTGRRALRHLLFQSVESDRTALKRFAVADPDTGELLLDSEITVSAVSGRTMRISKAARSAVSGQIVRPDELVRCDFTDARVLPSELRTSDVSQRRYRADQEARSAISDRTGHVSEFVKCGRSGDYLLETEGVRSDVTSQWIRPDLSRRSAKPPHRVGAVDELVRCSASGLELLTDEVVTSAVSQLPVDRDLTAESAASGRRALRTEMVTCEETAASLLTDEIEQCVLTGKRVDKRLIGRSAASGLPALARLLVRCELSGVMALPAETATCEVTGRRVVLSELGTCSATGKRALKDQFVVHGLTREPVLRDEAEKSSKTGRWCLKAEAVRCAWSGAIYLPDEVVTCTATGITVGSDLVDEQGMLRPLRALLEGQGPLQVEDPRLGEWVFKQYGGVIGRPARVAVQSGSKDGVIAVSAEVREGMLGWRVRFWGFVLQPSTGKTLGHAACGKRHKGRWVAERTVRLN